MATEQNTPSDAQPVGGLGGAASAVGWHTLYCLGGDLDGKIARGWGMLYEHRSPITSFGTRLYRHEFYERRSFQRSEAEALVEFWVFTALPTLSAELRACRPLRRCCGPARRAIDRYLIWRNARMADRNKTELTLRVTEAAALWLSGIGCKGCETEVLVARGWVADLAAFWSPTRTEARKQKLVSWELPFEKLPGYISIACEVKTSIGDFRKDTKWDREPPADIRILFMPSRMVPKAEWPKGWWVVLHHDAGGHAAVAQRAPLQIVSDAQRLRMAFALAERRFNRTNYAMWRDLARSHRNRENEEINRQRMDSAVNSVLDYLEGKAEIEGAWIPGQQGRFHVPFWLKERLETARAKFVSG